MHAYIHTDRHTYMHACTFTGFKRAARSVNHTHTHTYIHACMHAYIHTRLLDLSVLRSLLIIHTYIHICMHAYTHTYTFTGFKRAAQSVNLQRKGIRCMIMCVCVYVCVIVCLCVRSNYECMYVFVNLQSKGMRCMNMYVCMCVCILIAHGHVISRRRYPRSQ